MEENFNIIISGVGGQGIITLLQIIAEAALIEKKDVKTSEIHGLAQRGGNVESHIRFGPSTSLRTGQKVYSPLVAPGEADLILALEAQGVLKAINYAGKKTVFLINDQILPILGQKSLSKKVILDNLKKISSPSASLRTRNVNLIEATKIAKEEIGNPVVAGVFMLSLAVFKKFLPLKPASLLKAIKNIVRPKYFEINKKTFELAEEFCPKI